MRTHRKLRTIHCQKQKKGFSPERRSPENKHVCLRRRQLFATTPGPFENDMLRRFAGLRKLDDGYDADPNADGGESISEKVQRSFQRKGVFFIGIF